MRLMRTGSLSSLTRKGTTEHMALWKVSFSVLRRPITALFRVGEERSAFHYGMTNRCRDGRYILFLDYDKTPEGWVREEIRLFHELFPWLGTVYLFRTKHGIHAFALEKVTLGRILAVMDASSADKRHRDVSLYYTLRAWVLRQSEKRDETIKFLGTITRARPPREECSNAHRLYVWRTYRVLIPHSAGWRWDKETTITMGYYHTS